MTEWCLKMWCFLVLCPVLLAAGAQTLSIDSQLGTSVEDCFERISIGEQLPPSAIYRNISELTTRECEQLCKQDKQCQAYDYGVGAKGNATCNLSNQGEKELKEKSALNRNPDYDVYIRRIQCEQGPPSPLKPLQDEGDSPAHRPVFRPDVDDPKRPLSDEYLDSRPFETIGPERPYRPNQSYLNDLRPDDYYNQPAIFDRPPSYGLHKPQHIPYRPERPQDIPYRPQGHRPARPYGNYTDPYDVLQFQGDRPYPGNFRPDPHYPPRPSDDIPDIYGPTRPRPELPPFRPDEPHYVYITRPNKKPLRPNDIGYGNKPFDYPNKPYDDPRPPYKPSRPMDYPYRPYDRPSYDYNSQYASNYGQNQNNDNSVYVEIYDPPRPYKPSKPEKPYGSNYGQNYGYGSQDYGYGGSYSSQNTYTQSGLSSSYGSGSITQIDGHNRPVDSYRPQSSPSSGYDFQDRPEKPAPIYGPAQQEPVDYKPQIPSYSSGGSSYGSSQFEAYGGQSSYGSQTSQKPQDGYQKPSYDKPSYDNDKPSSGNNKPVYDSNKPVYDSYKPSYDASRPGYGNDRPSYDSNRPAYDSNRPTYGGSQASYGSSQNSYGNQIDQGYGSSSYGNRPIQPSYQELSQQSSYGGASQSYGYQEIYRPINDQRPSYDNRPSYDRPQYDEPYGNRPNDQSYDRPLYNKPPIDDRPLYDKPHYNRPNDKPGYNDNIDSKPGYGLDKPTDSYNKPGYGLDKPTDSYNKPNKPSSPYQPEFDNNRPDGSYGQEESEGYKSNKPKPNQTDGYNANKPNIKPVYEYEVEKPSNVPSYIVRPSGEVITSRPVTIGDYGNSPGYGREPVVSYKERFAERRTALRNVWRPADKPP